LEHNDPDVVRYGDGEWKIRNGTRPWPTMTQSQELDKDFVSYDFENARVRFPESYLFSSPWFAVFRGGLVGAGRGNGDQCCDRSVSHRGVDCCRGSRALREHVTKDSRLELLLPSSGAQPVSAAASVLGSSFFISSRTMSLLCVWVFSSCFFSTGGNESLILHEAQPGPGAPG